MPDYLVPARPHRRLQGQRRRLQRLALPRRDHRAAPRAARVRSPTSSTPTSRPRRSWRWDACSYRGAPVVGTFHAYSTKALPNHAGDPRRRAPQVQPADHPHRRLRGRRLDRQALVRRQLPDHPQRGRPLARAAGRAARAGRRAADPLRRPPRGAQGPPGSAGRVRGAGRARPRPADAGRRRPRGRRAAMSPTPRRSTASTRSATSARPSCGATSPTADVLCAPSLAGESFGMVLTEAFAAGHARDRLAHRRLRRRRHRRRRRDARPARRPAAARRGASAPAPRARAAARRWARRPAQSAERYAWPHVAEEVEDVYERAINAPEPADRKEARRPPRRPDPGRRQPAAGPPRASPASTPSPPRRSSRHRVRRRIALGRRRRPRRRADRDRRQPHRDRPGRDQHRPLRRRPGCWPRWR